jgi:hypothetical protein
VSLGLAAAVLHTCLKLRLGIPGHAAILWLTPLLLARWLAPMTAAASVSSTSTAVGLYCFGGFSLRWPLVLTFGTFWLVGPVLDLYVLLVERMAPRRRMGAGSRLGLVLLPLAGVVGNFAHLGLKVLFGTMRPHVARLGLGAGLYEAVTYLVFGLAAGIAAYALARPLLGRAEHDSPADPH